MKKILSLILAIATLGGALLFMSGCADPDESNIPWSRPQEWEGGVPGLGT